MRHFALSLLLAAPLFAQQTQPTTASGAGISGTVFCDDTGRPARFAKVFFTSAAPNHTGDDFLQEIQKAEQQNAKKKGTLYTPPTDAQKKQQAQAARQLNAAASLMDATNTGFDGTYRVTGLKPGTYYVHAQLSGYVDPYAQVSPEDFQSNDPAIRARIAALPTIRIDGENESQTANLHLQRGGSVVGRVLYDDGSPAVGWNVWALGEGRSGDSNPLLGLSLQREAALEMGLPVSVTDDRGSFRIIGMTDGQYILRADMGALASGVLARGASQSGSGIRISIYSGNALHPGVAKPFSVRQGEEETLPDLIIPMKSLHTLAGHVTATSDSHTLNKGTVMLSAKDDPQMFLRAVVQKDGSFRFEDLPGNTTYTLTLDDAADATYTDQKPAFLGIAIPKVDVKTTYAHASQDVVLQDADQTDVVFKMMPNDTTSTKPPTP
jgi:hypothetical protein